MVERKRKKNRKMLIWMVYSPGQDIVRSVAGPMACSLATIERYMEVLPEARPWEVDQHVAPVAWRKGLASPGAKKFRIGFLVDDGVVRVQPPIARAMREVIEALKAAGHEGMITDSLSQWLLRTIY
jgi:amidase